MADAGTTTSHVKSAMRTLDIIEYVVARGSPAVAQEIASALAIPVSSLSYLLATLVERGYLAREGRNYRSVWACKDCKPAARPALRTAWRPWSARFGCN
jgi:predicted ArsR family transcriptional regulator